MGYSLFLDGIHLPVGTDKLTVQHGMKSKEYDVLGQGRVQTPDSQELRTVSFTTEFPGQVYSYVEESAFQSPGKLIAKLRALQEEKKPFRFVAVGGDKLTMRVTLEQMDTTEQGGEDGDYEVSIRLKEYREFGVKTTDIPSLPRPGTVPEPKTVTLNPGETLQDKLTPSQKKAVETGAKTVLAFAMGKVINPAIAPAFVPIQIVPTEVHDSAIDLAADRKKMRQWVGIAKDVKDRIQKLNLPDDYDFGNQM